MSTAQDPLNGRKISDIILGLSQAFSSQDLSIRALRDALPGHIYGIVLLVLALPNLVPLPMPGLSAVTGLLLLLLSIQLAFKKRTPWLPNFILKRRIKTQHLYKVCQTVFPYLRRLERIAVPRFPWLLRYPVDGIIAGICIFLSLIIMLPVPFGNALPALAICLFSIAMLERDGLFTILGIFGTLASITVIAGVLTTVLMATLHLLGVE
jgi:hypothetical protein